jgi:hypothetical protein
MSSRLIRIEAPANRVNEDGAWIVFVRRDADGVTEYFIKASYYEGSYQQWGAPTPILGDNVSAVTQWAAGIAELESEFVRDEDEEDEDAFNKEELVAAGYDVVETSTRTFQWVGPDGDTDPDAYGSEADAWDAAWTDYLRYRR